MNREDIVAVCCRLFAVYLVIVAIKFVGSSILLNYQEPGMAPVMMIVAVATITCAIALYLWMFPLTISRKLLPAMKDSASGQTINSSIALGLGLALIGVWLFAHSLADLIYWAVVWSSSRAEGVEFVQFTPNQYANMVASAVKFVLAIVLILSSTGIRNAFLRLRFGSGAGF